MDTELRDSLISRNLCVACLGREPIASTHASLGPRCLMAYGKADRAAKPRPAEEGYIGSAAIWKHAGYVE